MGAFIGNTNSRKHGHASGGKVSPEHKTWDSMWQRCTNKKNPSYKRYGGRGIRVCVRWKKFVNFLADVGLRPSPEHSLDRFPDKHGNYEPGNVRWATPFEQQNNRECTVMIKAFGKTQALRDWSRENGIPPDTIIVRLHRLKWDPNRAVSEPLRGTHPHALELVKRAGYDSVSAFLRATGVQPSPFYKYVASPEHMRPASRERIRALLDG